MPWNLDAISDFVLAGLHFSPLFKESCRGTTITAEASEALAAFQSSIQRVMPWNHPSTLPSHVTYPGFQSSIQRVMPWNAKNQ